MNAQPNVQQQNPDDELTSIAVMEQHNSLPDISRLAGQIGHTLEQLFQAGVEEFHLDQIGEATADLVNQAAAMKGTIDAALQMLRQARLQRDEIREELDDLHAALRNMDTDHPDIEALVYEIDQMSLEWATEMGFEELNERIFQSSPLLAVEVSLLVGLLTEGVLPADSPAWEELRGWIESASGEVRYESRRHWDELEEDDEEPIDEDGEE